MIFRFCFQVSEIYSLHVGRSLVPVLSCNHYIVLVVSESKVSFFIFFANYEANYEIALQKYCHNSFMMVSEGNNGDDFHFEIYLSALEFQSLVF